MISFQVWILLILIVLKMWVMVTLMETQVMVTPMKEKVTVTPMVETVMDILTTQPRHLKRRSCKVKNGKNSF